MDGVGPSRRRNRAKFMMNAARAALTLTLAPAGRT